MEYSRVSARKDTPTSQGEGKEERRGCRGGTVSETAEVIYSLCTITACNA
ncbi:MAG: hypothetical protein JW885_16130 [Deltaproteobacteria bacterium]|nr:hypothetical protein [Candidatus Zymogenaceae bacterium]